MNLETEAVCPSCGAAVEPEQDGDTVFWPCACGYHFGHQRLQAQDDSCQIGIPEEVRRSYSNPRAAPELQESIVIAGSRIPRRPGI